MQGAMKHVLWFLALVTVFVGWASFYHADIDDAQQLIGLQNKTIDDQYKLITSLNALATGKRSNCNDQRQMLVTSFMAACEEITKKSAYANYCENKVIDAAMSGK